MRWVRSGLVGLFGLLLLLSLLGGVVSYSFNRAFSQPTRLEQWLDKSKFDSQLVSDAIEQSAQLTSQSGLASVISTKDTTIQQAIKDSFPTTFIHQSVVRFLNSNYAWLNGTASTPDFQIDLTPQKTMVAKQVGQSVATHLSHIPRCSVSQLQQLLQTTDLLDLTCLPPGVDPETEARQAAEQLNSSDFLNNPVITATHLNPNRSHDDSEPYYKKLSLLPTIYQVSQKLPWAAGVLAVVSLAGILFAVPTKRQGWRLIAKLLIIAGLLLTVARLALDITFNKLHDKLFRTIGDNGMQQALTDLIHRAINYVTHLELLGALLYLGLATVIIIGLVLGRFMKRRPKTTNIRPDSNMQGTPTAGTDPEPSIIADAPTTTSSQPTRSRNSRPHALGKRGSIQ